MSTLTHIAEDNQSDPTDLVTRHPVTKRLDSLQIALVPPLTSPHTHPQKNTQENARTISTAVTVVGKAHMEKQAWNASKR